MSHVMLYIYIMCDICNESCNNIEQANECQNNCNSFLCCNVWFGKTDCISQQIEFVLN